MSSTEAKDIEATQYIITENELLDLIRQHRHEEKFMRPLINTTGYNNTSFKEFENIFENDEDFDDFLNELNLMDLTTTDVFDPYAADILYKRGDKPKHGDIIRYEPMSEYRNDGLSFFNGFKNIVESLNFDLYQYGNLPNTALVLDPEYSPYKNQGLPLDYWSDVLLTSNYVWLDFGKRRQELINNVNYTNWRFQTHFEVQKQRYTLIFKVKNLIAPAHEDYFAELQQINYIKEKIINWLKECKDISPVNNMNPDNDEMDPYVMYNYSEIELFKKPYTLRIITPTETITINNQTGDIRDNTFTLPNTGKWYQVSIDAEDTKQFSAFYPDLHFHTIDSNLLSINFEYPFECYIAQSIETQQNLRYFELLEYNSEIELPNALKAIEKYQRADVLEFLLHNGESIRAEQFPEKSKMRDVIQQFEAKRQVFIEQHLITDLSMLIKTYL